MLTCYLPYWPVLFNVRLAELRVSLRRTPLRRGSRRVRPYLVMLEDRLAPAAPALPLASRTDESNAPIRVLMQFDNANSPFLGIPAPEVATATLSNDQPLSITAPSQEADGAANGGATRNESRNSANFGINNPDRSTADVKADKAEDDGGRTTHGTRPDRVVAVGRFKLKHQKQDTQNPSDEDGGKRFAIATIRNFLVPIRVVPESVAATLNIVSVPERAAPSTVPTATPAATTVPTVTTTATAASSPSVLLGGDVIAAATPVTAPVAVPGSSGAFTSIPTTAGVVLANFASAALTLPRTGGDTPTGDGGFRAMSPSTGMPVDGSATPGRPAPLPTAGSGAGVVTEELPDATLPPIELVPPVSDQTPPVAPIETGISGTAVLVATVAAAGLLAGTYYSQFRRSGRGPRLRVQG
jgi:hypothetical protein